MEIIVVVALLGLVLGFSIPRFRGAFLPDDTRRMAQWIMVKSRLLKTRAVEQQRVYVLHVSMESGRLWVTGKSDAKKEKVDEPDAEAVDPGTGEEFTAPEGARILDVEYAFAGKTSMGEAEIRFYPTGCSDRAFIHMEYEDGRERSFLIETFLPKVKMYDRYVGFDD
ncbi:MAG: hypothetical protein GY859_08595 [Desulfobacterales bacterium]|nr:hypothetical protein [Desulfobacterales bacterium]